MKANGIARKYLFFKSFPHMIIIFMECANWGECERVPIR